MKIAGSPDDVYPRPARGTAGNGIPNRSGIPFPAVGSRIPGRWERQSQCRDQRRQAGAACPGCPASGQPVRRLFLDADERIGKDGCQTTRRDTARKDVLDNIGHLVEDAGH